MQKKKGLTREQAGELYDDLQRAMNEMMTRTGVNVPTPKPNTKAAKEITQVLKEGLKGATPSPRAAAAYRSAPPPMLPRSPRRAGIQLKGEALVFLALTVLGLGKLTLDAIEYTGVTDVQAAHASVSAPRAEGPHWTKEEAQILTALDRRRVELEERSDHLDDREGEINSRDNELVSKLAELKELTERLRSDRERNDKQKTSQLDQLANVYGSMNPPEAAQLLEQLDTEVAISLLKRMPEKRIGQILALMSKEKALSLTNLLTRAGM